MTTWTIKTDEGHCFRVEPLAGGPIQYIWGEGGTVAAPSRTLPGGPRGTSSPEVLPGGARVRRASAGDAYSCAAWDVEVD
jgi:hypothetical protein